MSGSQPLQFPQVIRSGPVYQLSVEGCFERFKDAPSVRVP